MKHSVYTLLLIASVTVAFAAGSWSDPQGAVRAAMPATSVSVGYTCPMHREYTSDRAGDCPACGMRLVVDDRVGASADSVRLVAAPSAGAVHVSAETQQLIGVRVGRVERTSTTHSLRLVGRVAPAEARTYTVTAGIDGFVRDVSAVTTGSQVRKGQLLATFGAPDAIPAIQNYLVALNAIDRLSEGGVEGVAQAQTTASSANFQQRLEKLQDLGMSEVQMAEIRRTREVPAGIRILSPADGFVLARTISPGQRFGRGTDWYRIADLRSVWIVADLIGIDADLVHPGQRATVLLPGRKTPLEARVSEILPQFDPRTRTLTVRLEAANPGYVLRPDMVVDVNLPVALPPSVSVPVDAVLDSGLRQTVFVDRGEGVFEPRGVRTGWRFSDRVEIVEGLNPGERIVTSGTFLIDSESRMRLAEPRMSGTPGK
jgi:Cu(I)/Ag(I) efflux system membrane fusion protein